MQQLIRAEDMDKLKMNGIAQVPVRGTSREIDHIPVVRLHLPFSQCVWILTEVEPDDHDIAFGAADLGMGCPELGSIWLPELRDFSHGMLRVVQDDRFNPSRPLSWWIREAQAHSSLAAVREPDA